MVDNWSISKTSKLVSNKANSPFEQQESDDPRLLYEYNHQTWEADYESFLESL